MPIASNKLKDKLTEESVIRPALPRPALLVLSLSTLFLAPLGISAPSSPSHLTRAVGMPEVQNYSLRDYNGGGQVWTIAQDHWGILYFGDSSSAVIEFDGASWRKIFLRSSVVRPLKTLHGAYPSPLPSMRAAGSGWMRAGTSAISRPMRAARDSMSPCLKRSRCRIAGSRMCGKRW